MKYYIITFLSARYMQQIVLQVSQSLLCLRSSPCALVKLHIFTSCCQPDMPLQNYACSLTYQLAMQDRQRNIGILENHLLRTTLMLCSGIKLTAEHTTKRCC
jgi:hypothetical protein